MMQHETIVRKRADQVLLQSNGELTCLSLGEARQNIRNIG
jgi:hypothetical protein